MSTPKPTPVGGLKSKEYEDALKAHGGDRSYTHPTTGVLVRRNSFDEATLIHSLEPAAKPNASGMFTPVSKDDLQKLRSNGCIQAKELMALIPEGYEKPWDPKSHLVSTPQKWAGRDQIRTGRNWELPCDAGGIFQVRIHTRDNNQDQKSNSGKGSVLRVEFKSKVLRREALPTKQLTGKFPPDANWANLRGKKDDDADSTHIPVTF